MSSCIAPAAMEPYARLRTHHDMAQVLQDQPRAQGMAGILAGARPGLPSMGHFLTSVVFSSEGHSLTECRTAAACHCMHFSKELAVELTDVSSPWLKQPIHVLTCLTAMESSYQQHRELTQETSPSELSRRALNLESGHDLTRGCQLAPLFR